MSWCSVAAGLTQPGHADGERTHPFHHGDYAIPAQTAAFFAFRGQPLHRCAVTPTSACPHFSDFRDSRSLTGGELHDVTHDYIRGRAPAPNSDSRKPRSASAMQKLRRRRKPTNTRRRPRRWNGYVPCVWHVRLAKPRPTRPRLRPRMKSAAPNCSGWKRHRHPSARPACGRKRLPRQRLTQTHNFSVNSEV